MPKDELDSSASVIIQHDMFKETRYGKANDKVGRRKKFSIMAGCSVTENNLINTENEMLVIDEDATLNFENIDDFIISEIEKLNKIIILKKELKLKINIYLSMELQRKLRLNRLMRRLIKIRV